MALVFLVFLIFPTGISLSLDDLERALAMQFDDQHLYSRRRLKTWILFFHPNPKPLASPELDEHHPWGKGRLLSLGQGDKNVYIYRACLHYH